MKKDFQPFLLEREMSIWENRVAYNLSESGVLPLSLAELLDTELDHLVTDKLGEDLVGPARRQIDEILEVHGIRDRADRRDRVLDLLAAIFCIE